MYIIFYSDNVAFLFDIKAVSRLSALKRTNLAKFTQTLKAANNQPTYMHFRNNYLKQEAVRLIYYLIPEATRLNFQPPSKFPASRHVTKFKITHYTHKSVRSWRLSGSAISLSKAK